jgi:outer membrane protein assembly factor BamB
MLRLAAFLFLWVALTVAWEVSAPPADDPSPILATVRAEAALPPRAELSNVSLERGEGVVAGYVIGVQYAVLVLRWGESDDPLTAHVLPGEQSRAYFDDEDSDSLQPGGRVFAKYCTARDAAGRPRRMGLPIPYAYGPLARLQSIAEYSANVPGDGFTVDDCFSAADAGQKRDLLARNDTAERGQIVLKHTLLVGLLLLVVFRLGLPPATSLSRGRIDRARALALSSRSRHARGHAVALAGAGGALLVAILVFGPLASAPSEDAAASLADGTAFHVFLLVCWLGLALLWLPSVLFPVRLRRTPDGLVVWDGRRRRLPWADVSAAVEDAPASVRGNARVRLVLRAPDVALPLGSPVRADDKARRAWLLAVTQWIARGRTAALAREARPEPPFHDHGRLLSAPLVRRMGAFVAVWAGVALALGGVYWAAAGATWYAGAAQLPPGDAERTAGMALSVFAVVAWCAWLVVQGLFRAGFADVFERSPADVEQAEALPVSTCPVLRALDRAWALGWTLVLFGLPAPLLAWTHGGGALLQPVLWLWLGVVGLIHVLYFHAIQRDTIFQLQLTPHPAGLALRFHGWTRVVPGPELRVTTEHVGLRRLLQVEGPRGTVDLSSYTVDDESDADEAAKAAMLCALDVWIGQHAGTTPPAPSPAPPPAATTIPAAVSHPPAARWRPGAIALTVLGAAALVALLALVTPAVGAAPACVLTGLALVAGLAAITGNVWAALIAVAALGALPLVITVLPELDRGTMVALQAVALLFVAGRLVVARGYLPAHALRRLVPWVRPEKAGLVAFWVGLAAFLGLEGALAVRGMGNEWHHELPEDESVEATAVVADTVLAATSAGGLLAFEPATGAVRWSVRPGPVRNNWFAPTIATDGTFACVVPSREAWRPVVCLALADGRETARRAPSRLFWQRVDSGVLVVNAAGEGASNGWLEALDATSGALLWTHPLPTRHPVEAAADDGALFVVEPGAPDGCAPAVPAAPEGGSDAGPSGGPTLVAIDLASGRVRGCAGLPPGDTAGPPLVTADRVVVTLRTGLCAIARAAPALPERDPTAPQPLLGGRLWWAELPQTEGARPEASLAGDAVVVQWRRQLRAYDVATGGERWEQALDGPVAQIDAHGGALYVAVGDDLLALSAETGTARWRVPCRGSRRPQVAAGWLYTVCDGDELVARSAADGRLRWRTEVRGGRSVAVVTDGLVVATSRYGLHAWREVEPLTWRLLGWR